MLPQQLNLFQPEQPRTWTITDVNVYLRDLLESDHNLQDLWVQGEISNLSRPRSGHVYFTLKDAKSSLRCVMWRNTAARQETPLREGDAVEAHGNLSVYERSGQYQLYVDYIRPKGAGELYREFLRLKEQLEKEGLFDPEHKQKIPPWPRRIGIVTSATSAAFQDMLNTLRRRYPVVSVLLAPASVQGDNAPPQIVAGLQALNRIPNIDTIILGRGGGSIEDLWAFNDERVARAIYASRIPVISGVGHETDFTIADFVADLRAPTPTAAAELSVPDQDELRGMLQEHVSRLERSMRATLSENRWSVTNLDSRLQGVSPSAFIRTGRQRVDEMQHRLERAGILSVGRERSKVESLSGRLEALNPLAILERGYAILTRENGSHVRGVEDVTSGERLDVRVSDGNFGVVVED